MLVLVACEFSGVVRDAFRAQGHHAYSADLLPTERPSPHHYVGDVVKLLDKPWDLVIAHPPCTYLCNSGVRWLHTDPERWGRMREAAKFFRRFLELSTRVAVENPIMHRYAVSEVGRKHDQVIQPWQFGHGETKATCLWLKGLPPLRPTKIVDGREARVHRARPGPDRWKERSRTYTGIAAAMAEQWSNLGDR